ncbi:MAG: DUF2812 domain-containing protein [Lachnospiraceae bacterium]|nr:DUF2812 domain-containing protein [Lachnospiraceae bacterium]
MKTKNGMILSRYYTIADFEKEEAFLREQQRKGFQLKKFVLPCFYVFEACDPEDMVYRLDFAEVKKENKDSYIQIFTDCGWEYLFDVNGWSYFRKLADEADEDNEIFSDMESKIDLLGRVTKRRLVPLAFIFLCCILPQLVLQFTGMSSEHSETATFSTFFFWFFAAMFLVYSALFIEMGVGLNRLKRKYSKG